MGDSPQDWEPNQERVLGNLRKPRGTPVRLKTTNCPTWTPYRTSEDGMCQERHKHAQATSSSELQIINLGSTNGAVFFGGIAGRFRWMRNLVLVLKRCHAASAILFSFWSNSLGVPVGDTGRPTTRMPVDYCFKNILIGTLTQGGARFYSLPSASMRPKSVCLFACSAMAENTLGRGSVKLAEIGVFF